jgi:homospermidine synthase
MILIGCGGVGSAVLELLPICRLLPPGFASDLTIIEPRAIAGLPVLRHYKYRHVKAALTPANLSTVLGGLLAHGSFVFDCSVNVDALAVMGLCHRRGCLYINCSVEDWLVPDQGHIDPRPAALLARSLCSRIWHAKELYGRGPTMLADEGMNPGIVSSFALRGLEDMARAAGDRAAVEAMRAGQYARAAESLGVRAIHITERDTQTLRRPRPAGRFWNSWSAVGLVAEALDPVQLGRGTHEGGPLPGDLEVRNMRIVPARGMDVRAWSYSPARRGRGGAYTGMLIPHGEANTLSAALSGPRYRPSVYFVYQPAPFARASLAELRRAGYAPPPDARTHVATLPELRAGYDAVGALLWSDKHPPWWSGTVLDHADMAPLGLAYSGPTTIQVAIALLAAAKWMLAHPDRGFITPEDLPYAQILRDCEPYLGRVLSGPAPVGRRPAPYRLENFLGLAPRKSARIGRRGRPAQRPTARRALSRKPASARKPVVRRRPPTVTAPTGARRTGRPGARRPSRRGYAPAARGAPRRAPSAPTHKRLAHGRRAP